MRALCLGIGVLGASAASNAATESSAWRALSDAAPWLALAEAEPVVARLAALADGEQTTVDVAGRRITFVAEDDSVMALGEAEATPPARDPRRWTRIILDSPLLLDDSVARDLAEFGLTQLEEAGPGAVRGPDGAPMLSSFRRPPGEDAAVLWAIDGEPVYLGAIVELAGPPDAPPQPTTDIATRMTHDRAPYGPIALRLDPGTQAVVGIEAPLTWMVEGLRARAEAEREKPPGEAPPVPVTAPGSPLLPPLTRAVIGGPAEVRIRNATDFELLVGLRSGGSGRDFTVPAHGATSVSVPDGEYQAYFIHGAQPDEVQRARSFTLNGNWVEIELKESGESGYRIEAPD